MRAWEFIKEEINTDILHPEFSHTQEIGDYTYKATASQGWSGTRHLKILAFDPDAIDPLDRIAEVTFKIHGDEKSGYLESISTWVADDYREQGIASTMYAYARMLGNTIKPSVIQTDMGIDMWKAWEKSGSAKHLVSESAGSTVTLQQLYGGNYPDRDETFWDYVVTNDLNKPLTVRTMQRNRVMITLLSQYRAEHIDEITDRLDPDQKEIVDKYVADPNLSSKIILVANGYIIDGNHRALAAAVKGVPINYVDLGELDGMEDDDESP